jgi:hypothetical protein
MNCFARVVGLAWMVALGVWTGSPQSRAEAPFPDALERAAVEQSQITDIHRQALVLGNGDLIGLLWEHNGALCMRLAKNDIWDARVDTSQDAPLMKVDVPNARWSGGGYPPSWKKSHPQPRCAAAVWIGGPKAAGSWRAIRAGGREPLSITPGMPAAGVGSARLDLRRAVAELTGDKPSSVRVLADRNVVLIDSPHEVSFEEIKSNDLPDAELGETDGVKWLSMKMPGDVDWPGMEYALAAAAKGSLKAVAIVTSHDTQANVREAAIRLARETASADSASLVTLHERQWASYWSASGVELDDPDFQLWWYRMVYYLRCFARPGAQPIGLFAGLATNSTPWHGDYHHNYNAWQPYWTPLVINHPELTDPWIRYMNQMLPRMRWLARTTYDCEGACIGISSFAFEPDPERCQSVNRRQIAIPPFGYTLGMAGMSAQVLWLSHVYQPDRDRLEKDIYPVVREVALFYASLAEKCPRDAAGLAQFGPSYSPEHGGFGVVNVPFDLAYARLMLHAAIRCAAELKRDADLAERFRKAVAILPAYPTAPDEASLPVVVDWTGCKFGQIRQHNITVPDVPVFPAEQVTWFSPEPEKDLFRNTLRQTHHRGCNSTIMLSVAKARFSMPEALEDARTYYRPELQPNGMFHWPMHGFYLSESVGLAAMISEFLVQSVDGTIRVFPCWPKDKDGRFAGLRTQGGFLVSARQKSGTVVQVEVTSTAGGKLRLLSPWPTIQAGGRALTPDARGVVEIDTRVGEGLSLTPR